MTLDAAIAYVAEVTGDASLSWLEEAHGNPRLRLSSPGEGLVERAH
ncbi:hypothetical protein J4439_00910 [Candidatus Woesearchaeota archaeon]|nr:hypothetical protein [Candidatus Woesearchaeota archaeon]